MRTGYDLSNKLTLPIASNISWYEHYRMGSLMVIRPGWINFEATVPGVDA